MYHIYTIIVYHYFLSKTLIIDLIHNSLVDLHTPVVMAISCILLFALAIGAFVANAYRYNDRLILRMNSGSTSTVSPMRKYGLNENKFWTWKGQTIRYVEYGATNTGPTVLLVHGLFVNADHFRRNLPALEKAGYRAYAIDLLGNGYSSKPDPYSEESRSISGEKSRPDIQKDLADIELGTASGGSRVANIALAHPLGSVYNFFTWADQLSAFTELVIKPKDGKTVLVCNSIGTISSLQAAIDRPDLFDGCYVINPNFRELHVAESPAFIQPAVRFFQRLLRENGFPLFKFLATAPVVKNILREPYHVKEAVTDELVDVLLSPLLTEGAANVVFDTLSYSSGPLPEQQLQSPLLKNVAIEVNSLPILHDTIGYIS